MAKFTKRQRRRTRERVQYGMARPHGQCTAMTGKGRRCQRPVFGKRRCAQHGGKVAFTLQVQTTGYTGRKLRGDKKVGRVRGAAKHLPWLGWLQGKAAWSRARKGGRG